MRNLTLRADPATLTVDMTDVVDERGYESELIVALLSHARVDPSEVSPGTPLRGYWADSFDVAGEQTGSRLWLLEQAEATEHNARRAEAYASEALKFLLDSRRVRAIRPLAELEGDAVWLTVKVTERSGLVSTFGRYRVT